jgi:hypothetical protein
MPEIDSEAATTGATPEGTPAEPGQETLPAYPPAPFTSSSALSPQEALFGLGPAGKVRGTGACIGLTIVTLGIYSVYWYYQVHTELKRHSRTGLGGGVALLLALFVGIVMPYITSSEVGDLYERRGQAKPVSGATGLWSFPGIFILVGPIVWFVKTNGALNDYWRSVGATD